MLEPILKRVRDHAQRREAQRPRRDLERELGRVPAPRGFVQALDRAPHGLALIAELKKASPTSGVLRPDFDAASMARAYRGGGATALSVLTEGEHFQGALDHLERAAAADLPMLQKDFLQSEYQVLEGRAHGADAFLLIAAALTPERLVELLRLGRELGMDALVESHTANEWRRVAGLVERDPEHVLLGINNRNLETFEIDLGTSLQALSELPRGLRVVAESGIRTGADLVRLRQAGACAALVGTHLMRKPDLETATRELLAPLAET